MPLTNKSTRRAAIAVWAGLTAVALSLFGCGVGSRAVAVVDTPAFDPTPSGIRPGDVAGSWRWSHVTESEGVRRVESEHWQIKASKQSLVGFYEREVTFLSIDGVPFDCNQALSYKLRTMYEIEGTVGKDAIGIRERDYQAPESPCERGFRQLGEYTGEIVDGKLVLRWDGGEQTLVREDDIAATAPPTVETSRGTVAGQWQWSTRTDTGHDGIIRVESERWSLSTDGQDIAGTYDRTVTVFHEDGETFRCNGEREYSYTDRYTVRGGIVDDEVDDDQLNISEIEAKPDNHKCLVSREDRHLDHAVGSIVDGYLVLTWRGRHTQILHRPAPGADTAAGGTATSGAVGAAGATDK